MACVLKNHGVILPGEQTMILASTYLARYVPDEQPPGTVPGIWTTDIKAAQRFKDAGEALEFWRQVDKKVPVRSDGKPNRPLTMFTVEIVTVDDEASHQAAGS
jgi:hypothetical protein